ncbi:MAG: hypothetical protein Mars2KO_40940 [Maribacter sp.]
MVILLALSGCVRVTAQEETVIDNKGNIITVKNNVVTTGTSAPTSPIEGDVWFDTTDPNQRITSVWDGTAWQEVIHEGTSGSLFFAAADGRPNEDHTELFWDDTNNRLGVGTNAPSSKLEVTGAVRSQGIRNSNGRLVEPSYRFTSDSNTGMFSPADDEIAFSVGGIEAIRFDENSGSTSVQINEILELEGQLWDENDTAGTAGQVLIATTTGTAWSSQPIRAYGKIAANGAVTKATTGITVTKLAGNGYYRVNLPAGLVSDADYIIQLTQPGRGGAGNDDPGISYSNQTTTSFEVIIGDNDNGGSNRARFNSEFMFTVLDL